AAGWVGFAAGTRFEWRLPGTLPSRVFLVAFAPAATTVPVAVGACYLALGGSHLPALERVAVSAIFGAAAAGSGPSLAAIVRGRRAGRSADARSVLRMIELSASVGDLLVVVLAIVAFPLLSADLVPALGIAAVAAAGGGGLGI